MPVHHKLTALEAGLHFPRVVGVDPLHYMHCFTSTVLGHRRCLLRAEDKSIRESFALGCSLSLQPNIHADNYPITRGSEHDRRIDQRVGALVAAEGREERGEILSAILVPCDGVGADALNP
jgi:hypothetical protein